MMKIGILFLLMVPLIGHAQGGFFVAGPTYSTYSMKEFKSFQEEYIKESGLPLKAVVKFPAYWGYGAAIGLHRNEMVSWGVLFDFNSTGGRADYEDYSGHATMDNLLKSMSLGIFYMAKINDSRKWPLYFNISGRWVRTEMKIKESIEAGTSQSDQSYMFHSTNYGVRPCFNLRRTFSKLFVQAGIGYEFQFAGKLYFKDNPKAYFTGSSGAVTAQWDGLRVNLGLGVFLNKQKSVDE